MIEKGVEQALERIAPVLNKDDIEPLVGCYGILNGNNLDIWQKISVFIKKVEDYYIANRLQINAKKTQILITDNNNCSVNGSITLQDLIIKNTEKITLLGIIFSQYNNWNSHVSQGINCIITQLKRRLDALRLISKNFNTNQLKKLLMQYLWESCYIIWNYGGT